MGFKSSSVSSSAPPAIVQMEKQDKWKLASQLQKSIRHGHIELARSTALALSGLDMSYLRYRLCVMAVEDVGACNAPAILEDMQPGWDAKSVAARGGGEFLADLARRWAGSIKDRLPCDFLACRHWLAEFEQMHGPWTDLRPQPAMDIASDRTRAWWERGLAAWSVAGTERFPGGDLPRVEGSWEQWVEFASGFSGQPCAGLMRIAFGSTGPRPFKTAKVRCSAVGCW